MSTVHDDAAKKEANNDSKTLQRETSVSSASPDDSQEQSSPLRGVDWLEGGASAPDGVSGSEIVEGDESSDSADPVAQAAFDLFKKDLKEVRPMWEEYVKKGHNEQHVVVAFDSSKFEALQSAVSAFKEASKMVLDEKASSAERGAELKNGGAMTLIERATWLLEVVPAKLEQLKTGGIHLPPLYALAESFNTVVSGLTVAVIGLHGARENLNPETWEKFEAGELQSLMQDTAAMLVGGEEQEQAQPAAAAQALKQVEKAFAAAPQAFRNEIKEIQRAATKEQRATVAEGLKLTSMQTKEAAKQAFPGAVEFFQYLNGYAYFSKDEEARKRANVQEGSILVRRVYKESIAALKAATTALKDSQHAIEVPKGRWETLAGVWSKMGKTPEITSEDQLALALVAPIVKGVGKGVSKLWKQFDRSGQYAVGKVQSALNARLADSAASRDEVAMNAEVKAAVLPLLAVTQQLQIATDPLEGLAQEAKKKKGKTPEYLMSPYEVSSQQAKAGKAEKENATLPAMLRKAPSDEEQRQIDADRALRAVVATAQESTMKKAREATRRENKESTNQETLVTAIQAALKTAKAVMGQAPETMLDKEMAAALEAVAPEQRNSAKVKLKALSSALKPVAPCLMEAVTDLETAEQKAGSGDPTAAYAAIVKARDKITTAKNAIKNAVAIKTATQLNNFTRYGYVAKAIGEWAQAEKEAYLKDHPYAKAAVDRAMARLLDEDIRVDFSKATDPEGGLLSKRVELAMIDTLNGSMIWRKTTAEIGQQIESIPDYLANWGRKRLSYQAAYLSLSAAVGLGGKALESIVSSDPKTDFLRPRLRHLKIALAPVIMAMGIRKLKQSVRPGEPYPKLEINKYMELEVFKLVFRMLTCVLPSLATNVMAGAFVGYGLYRGGKYREEFLGNVKKRFVSDLGWSGGYVGGLKLFDAINAPKSKNPDWLAAAVGQDGSEPTHHKYALVNQALKNANISDEDRRRLLEKVKILVKYVDDDFSNKYEETQPYGIDILVELDRLLARALAATTDPSGQSSQDLVIILTAVRAQLRGMEEDNDKCAVAYLKENKRPIDIDGTLLNQKWKTRFSREEYARAYLTAKQDISTLKKDDKSGSIGLPRDQPLDRGSKGVTNHPSPADDLHQDDLANQILQDLDVSDRHRKGLVGRFMAIEHAYRKMFHEISGARPTDTQVLISIDGYLEWLLEYQNDLSDEDCRDLELLLGATRAQLQVMRGDPEVEDYLNPAGEQEKESRRVKRSTGSSFGSDDLTKRGDNLQAIRRGRGGKRRPMQDGEEKSAGPSFGWEDTYRSDNLQATRRGGKRRPMQDGEENSGLSEDNRKVESESSVKKSDAAVDLNEGKKLSTPPQHLSAEKIINDDLVTDEPHRLSLIARLDKFMHAVWGIYRSANGGANPTDGRLLADIDQHLVWALDASQSEQEQIDISILICVTRSQLRCLSSDPVAVDYLSQTEEPDGNAKPNSEVSQPHEVNESNALFLTMSKSDAANHLLTKYKLDAEPRLVEVRAGKTPLLLPWKAALSRNYANMQIVGFDKEIPKGMVDDISTYRSATDKMIEQGKLEIFQREMKEAFPASWNIMDHAKSYFDGKLEKIKSKYRSDSVVTVHIYKRLRPAETGAKLESDTPRPKDPYTGIEWGSEKDPFYGSRLYDRSEKHTLVDVATGRLLEKLGDDYYITIEELKGDPAIELFPAYQSMAYDVTKDMMKEAMKRMMEHHVKDDVIRAKARLFEGLVHARIAKTLEQLDHANLTVRAKKKIKKALVEFMLGKGSAYTLKFNGIDVSDVIAIPFIDNKKLLLVSIRNIDKAVFLNLGRELTEQEGSSLKEFLLPHLTLKSQQEYGEKVENFQNKIESKYDTYGQTNRLKSPYSLGVECKNPSDAAVGLVRIAYNQIKADLDTLFFTYDEAWWRRYGTSVQLGLALIGVLTGVGAGASAFSVASRVTMLIVSMLTNVADLSLEIWKASLATDDPKERDLTWAFVGFLAGATFDALDVKGIMKAFKHSEDVLKAGEIGAKSYDQIINSASDSIVTSFKKLDGASPKIEKPLDGVSSLPQRSAGGDVMRNTKAPDQNGLRSMPEMPVKGKGQSDAHEKAMKKWREDYDDWKKSLPEVPAKPKKLDGQSDEAYAATLKEWENRLRDLAKRLPARPEVPPRPVKKDYKTEDAYKAALSEYDDAYANAKNWDDAVIPYPAKPTSEGKSIEQYNNELKEWNIGFTERKSKFRILGDKTIHDQKAFAGGAYAERQRVANEKISYYTEHYPKLKPEKVDVTNDLILIRGADKEAKTVYLTGHGWFWGGAGGTVKSGNAVVPVKKKIDFVGPHGMKVLEPKEVPGFSASDVMIGNAGKVVDPYAEIEGVALTSNAVAQNGAGKLVTKEVAKNGGGKPVTKEVAKNGGGKPVTKEVAKNGGGKPVSKEVAKNGGSKPVSKEVANNGGSKPVSKEVTENGDGGQLLAEDAKKNEIPEWTLKAGTEKEVKGSVLNYQTKRFEKTPPEEELGAVWNNGILRSKDGSVKAADILTFNEISGDVKVSTIVGEMRKGGKLEQYDTLVFFCCREEWVKPAVGAPYPLNKGTMGDSYDPKFKDVATTDVATTGHVATHAVKQMVVEQVTVEKSPQGGFDYSRKEVERKEMPTE